MQATNTAAVRSWPWSPRGASSLVTLPFQCRPRPSRSTWRPPLQQPGGPSGGEAARRADLEELKMTTSSASPRPAERAFETVVLHAGGQFRASEKAVVEATLRRHPGVVSVEANPVAQTATVRY